MHAYSFLRHGVVYFVSATTFFKSAIGKVIYCGAAYTATGCDEKTQYWFLIMSLVTDYSVAPVVSETTENTFLSIDSSLFTPCENYSIFSTRRFTRAASACPPPLQIFESCIVEPHPLVAMDVGRGPSFPLPPGVVPSQSRTDMVELMGTSTDDRKGVLREVSNYFIVLRVAMLSSTNCIYICCIHPT